MNLTPVGAQGPGNGQLVSSGVVSPPVASNVNFTADSVDPNVAVARIGADGQVCFVNSEHTFVHVIADHLGSISAGTNMSASPWGAPSRRLDTRYVTPPPASSGFTFSPGQWLVGSQLPPGRYVMNAGIGCYWERQSGLGGSFDEILANDFRGAGRAIVEILPSDVAFEFDSECGVMTSYAGSAELATSIVPGSHVVGEHIVPGTYVTFGNSGCYWERLRGFSGDLDEKVASDFATSPGQQFVTILSTDVGFTSDIECGTWQRM